MVLAIVLVVLALVFVFAWAAATERPGRQHDEVKAVDPLGNPVGEPLGFDRPRDEGERL